MIFLIVILNVMVLPVLIVETPEFSNYTLNPNDLVVLLHVRPVGNGDFIAIGIAIAYMILVLLIILRVFFQYNRYYFRCKEYELAKSW